MAPWFPLLLTARDAVEDRVAGLNAGADDYLVKPFALPELVARVQSLCRRGYQREEPVLRCGTLTLDTLSRSASSGGQDIPLAPREYAVLEYLLRRSGEVISRREIEEHIYDANAEQFSNVVDTLIYALRKKLPVGPTAPQILTRRGQGYVLEG